MRQASWGIMEQDVVLKRKVFILKHEKLTSLKPVLEPEVKDLLTFE